MIQHNAYLRVRAAGLSFTDAIRVTGCPVGSRLRAKQTPLGLPTVRRFGLRVLRAFVVKKRCFPQAPAAPTIPHFFTTKCTKLAVPDRCGDRTTASPVPRRRPIQPARAIRWSALETLLRSGPHLTIAGHNPAARLARALSRAARLAGGRIAMRELCAHTLMQPEKAPSGGGGVYAARFAGFGHRAAIRGRISSTRRRV